MKKLIVFFAGTVLIALTLGMLFLTSAIYDATKKSSVDTYFFQTNPLSEMRPGVPETPAKIGETTMREMLIKKYVNEYFYAIPDNENIANRMRRTATLGAMSTSDVFNMWLNTEAPLIQALSEQKMMRMVDIDGEIYKPADSDYWVVPYIMYTWDASNDMDAEPIVTHGTLLMDVMYEPGVRETQGGKKFDIGNYLKHGYNRFDYGYEPAIIFKFRITHLEHVTND
ncbi:MAG: hypothetical protein J5679_02825 [Alphaproteobacteria bacterium]|nr:hypothetical protein [Alphaproteobacteria bacterium]